MQGLECSVLPRPEVMHTACSCPEHFVSQRSWRCRLRALLSSTAAIEAVALAATSTDSITSATAAPAAVATAVEQHFMEAGRGGHAPSIAAAASLRSVLSALAPAAADADGGVASAASAAHMVDTCLGTDEVRSNLRQPATRPLTIHLRVVLSTRCKVGNAEQSTSDSLPFHETRILPGHHDSAMNAVRSCTIMAVNHPDPNRPGLSIVSYADPVAPSLPSRPAAWTVALCPHTHTHTCLQFSRSEAAETLGNMASASDAATQRRCARTLASLFWRGRSAFVAGSVVSYLPAFASRRPADIYTISLLSPPPPMPGAAPQVALSPLAPLLDTLAAQLHTPASARRGVWLLMHTLRVLMTTLLCRKADLHPGNPDTAPTTASHVFVAAATVTSAVAWLKRVPDPAAMLPAMIGVVQMLLDLFAVPVAEGVVEGPLPVRGVSVTLGRGNPVAATTPGRDAPRDTSLLSSISLFLKGVSCAKVPCGSICMDSMHVSRVRDLRARKQRAGLLFVQGKRNKTARDCACCAGAGCTSVPSLAVTAMPVDLLLALRDGLTPPSRPATRSPAGSTRADPGFRGWHTVSGTGATAAAAAQASGSDGAAAAGSARDRGGGREWEDREAEAAKGLAFGYASARDARVAVYILLLWKFQLDSAALEEAGGCRELQKVCHCRHDRPGTSCGCWKERACDLFLLLLCHCTHFL